MFASAVAIGAIAYAVGTSHGAEDAARAIVAQQAAAPAPSTEATSPGLPDYPEISEEDLARLAEAEKAAVAPVEDLQAESSQGDLRVGSGDQAGNWVGDGEFVSVGTPGTLAWSEDDAVGAASVEIADVSGPAGSVSAEVDVSAIVAETVAATVAELRAAEAPEDAAEAEVSAARPAVSEPVVSEPVVDAPVVGATAVEPVVVEPVVRESEVGDFRHFSTGDAEVVPAAPERVVAAAPEREDVSGAVQSDDLPDEGVRDSSKRRTEVRGAAKVEIVSADPVSHVGR